MPRSRKRTYLNDVTTRSFHVGQNPVPPGIGQTNNPSGVTEPAHLALLSTPATASPGSPFGGVLTPAAATVVAGNGTINTQSSNCRVNPAGNVTGIILQTPQIPAGATADGNLICVVNESAFTLTFATDATSNVYNGTAVVIPAKTAVFFIWDPKLSTAGLYVPLSAAVANLSGNQAITGNMVITSTSANALAVGRQGATNPVLNVDASAATVVTGLNIAGAAASAGLALSVTSSAGAENLTIDAKGTGTISLNATATGNVIIGSKLQMTTAASSIVPGATSLAFRNNADNANNILIADAGGVTFRTNITFASASAKLIPGATAFLIRDTGDANTNINITDAGVVTVRGGIVVTAGGLQITAGGLLINGAAGSANSSVLIQKSITAIADNTFTDAITVTIPNAAHGATILITLVGSLGAGGAIGAFEASGTLYGAVAVARTAGVNAVAVASTATATANANVAGAATITTAYQVSAIAGAVGATNTFTIQIRVTKGGGASANHTAIVQAEVMNSQATGVTIA